MFYLKVLDAVSQHNARLRPDDEQRIVIDVLTGASAGGMTAIILAQKLLYNGDQFGDPYDNPLYNIWVKRITLEGLQAPNQGEAALDSIFSSDLIESISKEALAARYGSTPLPNRIRHNSIGDRLQVGVALTNLNGLAYGYPVEPNSKFTYVDYVDQLTAEADGTTGDSLSFWEPLRMAAVACDAFPFAFRTQDLQRSRGEYQSDNLEPWDHDPATFTYSDGGILQNQPLGIAKNLVDLSMIALIKRADFISLSRRMRRTRKRTTVCIGQMPIILMSLSG